MNSSSKSTFLFLTFALFKDFSFELDLEFELDELKGFLALSESYFISYMKIT